MEQDSPISIHLATAANAAMPDRIDPDVFDHPVRADLLAVAVADGVVVGMASRLIAAVLDQARSIGCVEAWVATEVDNLPARELYRRTGAREDDQHADVYIDCLHPLA